MRTVDSKSRNPSPALLKGALVRAGGRDGRRAQESGSIQVYAPGERDSPGFLASGSIIRFLDPRNGDEFLEPFFRAARGDMQPFILVVEGSIPGETNKAEGYWAALGTDLKAVGTCAAYGGIHAMEGNPTGCMGLPDYLGWKWTSSEAHRPTSLFEHRP